MEVLKYVLYNQFILFYKLVIVNETWLWCKKKTTHSRTSYKRFGM